MKGKFLSLLMAIAIAVLASAPIATAFPDVQIYGYTDKAYYNPGETVTLKYWVYNWGPEDVTPKNVTIEYPWYSPMWDGNNTIIITGASLSKDENWSATETFTIPNDGRGHGGNIEVTLTYAYGSGIYTTTEDFSIDVHSTPIPASLDSMDRLMTMFTVQTVLIILGAVIIAAAIFLSRHKPQVTWKEEHKAE